MVASNGASPHDIHAAIYRAEDPHVYRVESFEVWPDGTVKGLTTTEIRVEWTATGVLTTGTLSLLPACSSGQTNECSAPSLPTTVILIPPIFARAEVWDARDPRVRSVQINSGAGPGAPVAVDFGALLAASTWNG